MEKDFESLLKQLQESLKERVKEVRLTNRLTDSPACVVSDENEMSAHMQRMMGSVGDAMPASKPIFELNPKHQLILRLKEEQDDERLKRWVNVLLDQAMLAEGEQLKNPAEYVKQLNQLLLELLPNK